MKQIIYAYASVSVLLFGLLALLSYGHGAGYVYIAWRGWQLQTTLWLSLALLVVVSLLLQSSWWLLKRRKRRQQRQIEQPLALDTLHPYEQLGVLWLLNTAEQQQGFIQQVFSVSGLLQHVVHAKLAMLRKDYTAVLTHLQQAPPSAFELVSLIQVECLLEQQHAEEAFAQLETLQQQPLSVWLQPLQTAYQRRLVELWAMLALQRPWLYLHSQQQSYLPQLQYEQWLQQMLLQFDHADFSDLSALQQHFFKIQPELNLKPFRTQLLWLKLLARQPDMALAHEQLALQLLDLQFEQDVFYLWFQQKMLVQQPNFVEIENTLNQLDIKYPSLPILTFARWHIDQAQGRSAAADALLSLYPDNVLMSYLRIKNRIKDDTDLQQQLNLVFNSDAKFIQLKL